MAETKLHTIQDDPKGPPPFLMIESMMPMYPLIAVMGWMIVGIAFLVGLLVLAPAADDFYSAPKAVREIAPGAEDAAMLYSETTGEDFEIQEDSFYIDAQQSVHVTETWVPQFKFLGLGMGLMAIAMALGVIAKRLRRMGKLVNAHMNPAHAPAIPEPPTRRRFQQLTAMMGIMLLIVTLIIGIVLATGDVSDYWGNAQTVLNAAEVGGDDGLLDQLGTVASFQLWLNPLRMIGMMMLFVSITIGLTLIIYVLRLQSELLVQFYNRSRGG